MGWIISCHLRVKETGLSVGQMHGDTLIPCVMFLESLNFSSGCPCFCCKTKFPCFQSKTFNTPSVRSSVGTCLFKRLSLLKKKRIAGITRTHMGETLKVTSGGDSAGFFGGEFGNLVKSFLSHVRFFQFSHWRVHECY